MSDTIETEFYSRATKQLEELLIKIVESTKTQAGDILDNDTRLVEMYVVLNGASLNLKSQSGFSLGVGCAGGTFKLDNDDSLGRLCKGLLNEPRIRDQMKVILFDELFLVVCNFLGIEDPERTLGEIIGEIKAGGGA